MLQYKQKLQLLLFSQKKNLFLSSLLFLYHLLCCSSCSSLSGIQLKMYYCLSHKIIWLQKTINTGGDLGIYHCSVNIVLISNLLSKLTIGYWKPTGCFHYHFPAHLHSWLRVFIVECFQTLAFFLCVLSRLMLDGIHSGCADAKVVTEVLPRANFCQFLEEDLWALNFCTALVLIILYRLQSCVQSNMADKCTL